MRCWSMKGTSCEGEVRALLGSGEWPARNIDRNISDLKAQLAACVRGAEVLAQTARDYGPEVIAAYMRHVLANAEESVRRLLGRLDDGAFEYEMDNGARVAVKISIDKASRSATFDFTGTSAQLPDNFNAPYSIVRAASLYVVRTLVDDPIPMNDGCLRPIKLVVPDGCMLAPAIRPRSSPGMSRPARSSPTRLFAATGRLAPSQGTMNNFTFGNERHQYYETIAGGSGAGPDHDGTSAVQTHMTNSRLTDPEVLETRLPVRLERFRDPSRLGRQGSAFGRRRSDSRRPLSRADARKHARQSTTRRAEGARGRRRCAARPQLGRARGRHDRRADCHRRGGNAGRRPFCHRDARRRRVWSAEMSYWPLLGILLVVLGFALKLNPMLVVTGAAHRHRPARREWTWSRSISTFGKAFNDNRIIAIVWIVLPVIGLLERYGLQQRAAAVIRGFRNATTGKLLLLYLIYRQITAAIGLHSTAGHPQTVRPLVAPMALAAAEKQHGELERGDGGDGEGLFRRDRQCRPVLRRGHLLRHRLHRPDPGDALDLRL